MPSVNAQINPQFGPLIDVQIHVSEPRAHALTANNQVIPPAVSARLLIDTGASNTCIDPRLIAALGIAPTGSVPMHTPTTAGTPVHCDQYDIKLIIPHPVLSRVFGAVPVLASDFSAQGMQGLLGRDILAHCVFIANGEIGFYTLSF